MVRFERASVRAGSVNEDLIGRCGRAFWVLDGSTPLYPARSGARSPARRFVEVINDSLHKHLCRSNGDLRAAMEEVASDAAKFLRRRRPSRPSELPSAAAGVIRLDDEKLEYALLGDVTIAVDPGDGVQHLTDPRVTRLDERALKAVEREREKGAEDVKGTLQEVLRENRDRMNRKRAYWVFGADSDAGSQARRGQIPLAGRTRLLVASDGFTRAVEPFHLYEWDELLAAAARRPLKELVAEIRQVERRDPDCVHYPRLSRSDDASAIYLEYQPARARGTGAAARLTKH